MRWYVGRPHSVYNVRTEEDVFIQGRIVLRDDWDHSCNEHVWVDENDSIWYQQQWQFAISLWAGVLGDCFVGPHILPEWIGGRNCLDFLSNALEGTIGRCVQYALRMWFLHNDAVRYYSRDMGQWFSEKFRGHWISRKRNASVYWLSRSPDFSPLHSVKLNILEVKIYTQNLWTLAKFSSYFDSQNQTCKVWHIVMRHWIFRFKTLNLPVIPPVYIITVYVAHLCTTCWRMRHIRNDFSTLRYVTGNTNCRVDYCPLPG
jgi:hypothetical protein